jgi:PBP1b-binding outer membrane lipoprotein LpoB
MHKTNRRMLLAGSALLVALGAGCETTPVSNRPPSPTRRVGETQTLETRRLNQRDLEDFAAELAEGLIRSGRLMPFDDQGPPLVLVSRFINEGGRGTMHVDRNRVFARVLDALNRAGVATAYVDDDPAVEAMRREAAARGEALPSPDYSVVLRLYEDVNSVGRIEQFQYILQMQVAALDGPRAGAMVWSEEREIAKQAPRGGAVGL